MVISPQRLTIYLYSMHRAVIFAIAQLSCYFYFRYKIVVVHHIFHDAEYRVANFLSALNAKPTPFYCQMASKNAKI